MFYFAYGSNMSSRRLTSRVSGVGLLGVAKLARHTLRFHKIGSDGSAKCDVIHTGSLDHFVMGVVFRITDSQKPILDKIEGLGVGYEEKTIELKSLSGEDIEASTYIATHVDPALKPYHWYKHHVLTGAREHGLPDAYIEQISAIESIDDSDQGRHDIEMAIYL